MIQINQDDPFAKTFCSIPPTQTPGARVYEKPGQQDGDLAGMMRALLVMCELPVIGLIFTLS